MIINAIVGVNTAIYTAGWDGFVKKLVDIEIDPTVSDEANVSSCVNSICVGASDNIVYAGCSDGTIKKIVFS